jgi:Raf kinase inhibitor-like YbhB/YbcL family protein
MSAARRRKHVGRALALLLGPIAASGAWPSPPAMHVSSTSFVDGGKMPARLTCDGANLSPQIRVSEPPAGTRSLAIVMTDPDAPVAFAHWLAYDVAADTRELPEGAATPSQRLGHAIEGINGFGRVGYGGPCPPSGATHHYVLHVYALDASPNLPAGANAPQLQSAIQGHVLAESHMTGVYTRAGD